MRRRRAPKLTQRTARWLEWAREQGRSERVGSVVGQECPTLAAGGPDGSTSSDPAETPAPPPPATPTRADLESRILWNEGGRIAARAANPNTRRQYAAIYRAFTSWLTAQLGRPAVVGDISEEVIAAYGRHLAIAGGRGGRPAAPTTTRMYLSMIRALARQLGREARVSQARAPEENDPTPPARLTDRDYRNLLLSPDRRTPAGKRDYALLRVLGDCGLRSAELRALRADDLSRGDSGTGDGCLVIRGRGSRQRTVPIPPATQIALEEWLEVHPLTHGDTIDNAHPLFVRLGRHAHQDPAPLSTEAVFRAVRRHCRSADVPEGLAHPQALRDSWATRNLEIGIPVDEVSLRLGHADRRTTLRYAATRTDGDSVHGAQTS